jgi:sulfate adenylyltransferase large subunit
MLGLTVADAPETFDAFLQQEQAKDLLRFTTAGSVDDGKSTLIGRLLYDSRSVYEDQLESVTKASAGRNAGAIDFSLLTDGLRAEREQGITIDVAYRYFATPKRKFIIADTPGHEQYTRNMVTGASTAELAIVLVDARKGLLPQSRRHAYISSLLGLPHLVIAVNKMDLVGYDQAVFAQIEDDFRKFLSQFRAIEPYFVPISALAGDNVVTNSTNMAWFRGPSLLHHLESVPVGSRVLHQAFRFPVQRVVRPNLDFRGYAGTVASGTVRAGERIVVLPSGRETTVSTITTFDGDLEEARAGQSVTLTLADEVDISRGDTLAAIKDRPQIAQHFETTIVWLNSEPAVVGKRYRVKQATSLQWADLAQISYRININSLEHEAADTLEMNAIGRVRLETARPLVFDSYEESRTTGSFILIDPATNATVAAGLLIGKSDDSSTAANEKHLSPVTLLDRTLRQGHTGAQVELGGRSELAWRLERSLFDRGCNVFLLDNDSPLGADLVQLGALIIYPGHPEQGFVLKKEADLIDTRGERLPESDAEAVAVIEGWLERAQVLRGDASWTDSGGI